MAPFEYRYFDSLDPEATVLIAEHPRYYDELPLNEHGTSPPTFICFSIEDGEDADAVHHELFQWLHANGLPAGHRVAIDD